jgi:two-component system OmpR family response regulator
VADIPRLHGINVLVVDDHEDTAEMFAQALQFCEASVVTSTNARSGLETFNRTICHVVLTDLAMPHEDGIWLLQQIRDSARPRTPVVAITGDIIANRRAAVEAAGFAAIVVKPVDPFDLCWLVLKLLGRA